MSMAASSGVTDETPIASSMILRIRRDEHLNRSVKLSAL